jgi:hypothetical protein
VTYRADSMAEIVTKAERLGSARFLAVASDGKRTPILKVDGQWQRGPERPALSDRPPDLTQGRDEVPAAASGVHPHLAGEQHHRASAPEQVGPRDSHGLDLQVERAALVARVEATLQERYVIKRSPATMGDISIGQTEYRFRGDTSRVAFTESTFRLATDTNSPSVARSMVDVAEARGWKGLRVSGHDDFRRMVWLEASVRGVKTQGYEPNPGDLEVLRREREARLVNRVEPAQDGPAGHVSGVGKASGRGSGGRKAVLAAIEAILVAKRVPEKQRVAVMVAANEKLAERIREGTAPKIKLYDKEAPTRRSVTVPSPEVQRSRDRTSPTR